MKSTTSKKLLEGYYPKPCWAVSQIMKIGGVVEDICEHGCGHPNALWLAENCKTPADTRTYSTHGCDGCCSQRKCNCSKDECYGSCTCKKETTNV